ncbi:MAG TPA: hypothetical protein VH592_14440 [Gemmataceae bacterium]
MAPFFHEHCPVCSKVTWQHFLAQPPDAESDLCTICEICETVLIYGENGLLGQRAATEEEREDIPKRPKLSPEELAAWREDLRQGQEDVEAWIQSGCPGLSSVISQIPSIVEEVQSKIGVNPSLNAESIVERTTKIMSELPSLAKEDGRLPFDIEAFLGSLAEPRTEADRPSE